MPKAHASSEVRGLGWAPIGKFLDVYSLSPLSWVSELFRQDIGQIFNLESVLTIKNIFIMKNVTNFRKKGETGVDLRLIW